MFGLIDTSAAGRTSLIMTGHVEISRVWDSPVNGIIRKPTRKFAWKSEFVDLSGEVVKWYSRAQRQEGRQEQTCVKASDVAD